MTRGETRRSRYPGYLTDGFIGLMLFVYPLWVGKGGYTDLTAAKYRFFAVAAAVYLSLLTLLLIELAVVGKGGELSPFFRGPWTAKLFLFAYLICCCISALFSAYGTGTWAGLGRYEGLRTILLYLGLFAGVSLFGRLRDWHLYLLGAAVLINTVLAALQYAGLNPFGLFPAGYTYHDAFVLYANQFLGTLGNTDLLSSFLSVAIPLFFARSVAMEKGARFVLPFAAGVFLLLLAGASAGILGVCAGLLLMAPLLLDAREKFSRALSAMSAAAFASGLYFCLDATYENRVTTVRFSPGLSAAALFGCAALLAAGSYLPGRNKASAPWRKDRARRLLCLLVAACILLGLAALLLVPFSAGTLREAQELLRGNADPSFGSGRLRIWTESLKLVPGHLWLGGGPDTLAGRIGFSFTRYSEQLGATIESKIDNAHNDYLNILVNTGLLSLLCYLAALFTCVLRAVRRSERHPAVLLPLAAVVSYSIQVFFSFSICITAPFFWMALAWCDGSAGSIRDGKEMRHER